MGNRPTSQSCGALGFASNEWGQCKRSVFALTSKNGPSKKASYGPVDVPALCNPSATVGINGREHMYLTLKRHPVCHGSSGCSKDFYFSFLTFLVFRIPGLAVTTNRLLSITAPLPMTNQHGPLSWTKCFHAYRWQQVSQLPSRYCRLVGPSKWPQQSEKGTFPTCTLPCSTKRIHILTKIQEFFCLP